LIDLYPTLIDLCGLPEKVLDGKSIKPLLQNPMLEWTPTLTTYGEGNHSVMSEKWHYITRRNGVEELYDLENDPLEWTNLMQTHPGESQAVIAKLTPFLPRNDAKEIPKSTKKKSIKTLDMTIKPRRDSSKLK
jgi:arylsulfatase A-like enzyme